MHRLFAIALVGINSRGIAQNCNLPLPKCSEGTFPKCEYQPGFPMDFRNPDNYVWGWGGGFDYGAYCERWDPAWPDCGEDEEIKCMEWKYLSLHPPLFFRKRVCVKWGCATAERCKGKKKPSKSKCPNPRCRIVDWLPKFHEFYDGEWQCQSIAKSECKGASTLKCQTSDSSNRTTCYLLRGQPFPKCPKERPLPVCWKLCDTKPDTKPSATCPHEGPSIFPWMRKPRSWSCISDPNWNQPNHWYCSPDSPKCGVTPPPSGPNFNYPEVAFPQY